jgi:hypothetical protein
MARPSLQLGVGSLSIFDILVASWLCSRDLVALYSSCRQLVGQFLAYTKDGEERNPLQRFYDYATLILYRCVSLVRPFIVSL